MSRGFQKRNFCGFCLNSIVRSAILRGDFERETMSTKFYFSSLLLGLTLNSAGLALVF